MLLTIVGAELLFAAAYWHLLGLLYPALQATPLLMQYSVGLLEIAALYTLWKAPVFIWQLFR